MITGDLFVLLLHFNQYPMNIFSGVKSEREGREKIEPIVQTKRKQLLLFLLSFEQISQFDDNGN